MEASSQTAANAAAVDDYAPTVIPGAISVRASPGLGNGDLRAEGTLYSQQGLETAGMAHAAAGFRTEAGVTAGGAVVAAGDVTAGGVVQAESGLSTKGPLVAAGGADLGGLCHLGAADQPVVIRGDLILQGHLVLPAAAPAAEAEPEPAAPDSLATTVSIVPGEYYALPDGVMGGRVIALILAESVDATACGLFLAARGAQPEFNTVATLFRNPNPAAQVALVWDQAGHLLVTLQCPQKTDSAACDLRLRVITT